MNCFFVTDLHGSTQRYRALFQKIEEDKIITKVNFSHPYFNSRTAKLQKELFSLQGKKRTWFCGSYFGYGFHEDGLKSSIEMINNFN